MDGKKYVLWNDLSYHFVTLDLKVLLVISFYASRIPFVFPFKIPKPGVE